MSVLAGWNVFDWAGPDFLKFYALFAMGVLALQFAAGAKQQPIGRLPDLSDPYLIACLRGGATETLVVATLALIDRGLLKVEGELVSLAAGTDLRSVQLPVEQALLTHFEQPQKVSSLRKAVVAARACDPYATTLASFDLHVPSTKSAPTDRAFTVAVVLLVGVAALKVSIALSRGRSNVFFLIFFAAVAVVLSAAVSSHSQHDRERDLLKHLRAMLGGLPARAKSLAPGAATAELSLLAAVFGLSFVPLTLFPARDTLFRDELARASRARRRAFAATRSSDDGGFFSSFVSCGASGGGSSCGASGGSSCGGGGCGGGGCGGCSS